MKNDQNVQNQPQVATTVSDLSLNQDQNVQKEPASASSLGPERGSFSEAGLHEVHQATERIPSELSEIGVQVHENHENDNKIEIKGSADKSFVPQVVDPSQFNDNLPMDEQKVTQTLKKAKPDDGIYGFALLVKLVRDKLSLRKLVPVQA